MSINRNIFQQVELNFFFVILLLPFPADNLKRILSLQESFIILNAYGGKKKFPPFFRIGLGIIKFFVGKPCLEKLKYRGKRRSSKLKSWKDLLDG